MAAPKPPNPPKKGDSGVPRLYADDVDGDDGAPQLNISARLALTIPAAAATERVDAVPPTVRALDQTGEYDDTGRIPNVDDSIPNVAEDDGTHTDKTALLTDRSLRRGDRPTLTILTGMSAGLVRSLEKLPVTIGRLKGVELQITDAGVSRKHARVIMPTPGLYILEDLGSTNGLRVNGVRSKRCDLRAGDRIQLGPEVVLQFAYLDDAEENLTKQLYTAATRDSLTLALNRGTFDERLTAEMSYASRHGSDLSVIIFDVDHFKRVNDTHGHGAGDAVLQELSQTVRRTIRHEDVFARYGGEEFAILVRGESCAQAAAFAERLRAAIAATNVPWQASVLRVTVSLGVAERKECASAASPRDLVALADQRLYVAKQSGRNRVCAM